MKVEDVLIIGAGPAGMNAALYANRAGLSTRIITCGLVGGQMNNTATIENFIGFKQVSGEELGMKMGESLAENDIDIEVFKEVTSIKKKDGLFETTVEEISSKELIYSKYVIVATGTEHSKLEIENEDELSGRGVSYCAVCDGDFFKNDSVVVVGGGNSALDEAIYLSKVVKEVLILVRGSKLSADRKLIDDVNNKLNVNIALETEVSSIVGDDQLDEIYVKNKISENKKLPDKYKGLFIYVGIKPNTSFLLNGPLSSIIDEDGWIVTSDDNHSTKEQGIYAIGDVRKNSHRQIAEAIGDSVSAVDAIVKLERNN